MTCDKRTLKRYALERLTEPSTIRGIVWVVGSVTALAFLWASDSEDALKVLALAGAASGGIGAATQDR